MRPEQFSEEEVEPPQPEEGEPATQSQDPAPAQQGEDEGASAGQAFLVTRTGIGDDRFTVSFACGTRAPGPGETSYPRRAVGELHLDGDWLSLHPSGLAGCTTELETGLQHDTSTSGTTLQLCSSKVTRQIISSRKTCCSLKGPEPEADSQEQVHPKTGCECEDGPDGPEVGPPNPEEVKTPEEGEKQSQC
ncbi:GAGE1 isoform 4 [Pongo abelii]|uniref:GAGE1 isoform 2 n=2 Tax=Pongo abelii TaxID=9601 RepID=A0A2J8R8A0_PONAB|nr:GAGE1 isoform 2 [Pongo abelii]PNJ04726.1 GAGE1 isoform 3 [Pongo abelii]PNJ04727.1 GAGE1 isoform 4 [Pongo abelii]